MNENIPTSTMNVTVADTIVANKAARKFVPGFGGRIAAALVWDGTDEVRIPEAMGVPRADQMQGTPRERLTELSGRVCYDAMGVGRPTKTYFEHILQVGHLSIVEHAAFTVEIKAQAPDMIGVLMLNRPGAWTRVVDEDGDKRVRITLNPRVVLDWTRHGQGDGDKAAAHLAEILLRAAGPLAPGLFTDTFGSNNGVQPSLDYFGIAEPARVVEPESDHEKWITLYLTGSRGWGNELVRHRWMSAISQRSTRYVSESESEWVMHPLLAQWLDETDMTGMIQLGHNASSSVGVQLSAIKSACSVTYDGLVSALQPWLEAKGVDKVSARKQARGAARGLLGIALETEVVYSACVASWRHILRMRAADAADAEIRLGFAEAVLPCLKASRYGDRFQDFALAPAKDGIGRSLSGGGAK